MAPTHGTPVGLEIPVKDTARGAAFYSAVFGWQFKPSHLGIPEDKILIFTVPDGVFPAGGALRQVEDADIATVKGTSKVYFYVDDLAAAIEKIVSNGGKKISDPIPEGSTGFFQFFEDSEGNGHGLYKYN
ncbi:hypothetical protein VHEMI08111 [[Torrubiella] hemipterigena]|uniref:VOC domain-containing protein n=1 Tax=[Torrubiella] hemipterigena TaxID=1531966 RepID=A0A0A1TCE5_9HYPO|nr:hypothetical protein VHEMI08111 [[Torrubiella] hemipterigena]